MNEPKKLLQLQQIDTEIDKLEARKENLSEKSNYEKSLTDLMETQKELTKKIKEQESEGKKQNKLEGELERISFKVKAEEDKLYSGKIQNPKELMSIQEEIKMLQRERDELETAYLKELDMVEQLEKEVKLLDGQEKKFSVRTDELKAAYDEVSGEIDRKLAEQDKKREEIVAGIEEDTYRLYERLRKEKGGVAVALVKNGVCQGCGVEISTEEEDLMFKEERLWRCEHCKRILLR